MILTIAADLGDKEIYVYSKDVKFKNDGTIDPTEHNLVINKAVHKFPKGVSNLNVSADRAIFGNDIDADEGSLNKAQAFEGKLYSLRVYNKMLDPAQIDTDGDRYLHYSVSSDNVVTDED